MGPLSKERRWRSRKRREETPESEVLLVKLFSLRVLVVALFAVLALQLFRMQVINGDDYELRAQQNRLREVAVLPSRGLVYDRYGNPLVSNVPSFSAAVIPADVPRDDQARILSDLESLLDVRAGEVAYLIEVARGSKDPFSPIVVKRDLDEETAFTLKELEARMPGVTVIAEPVRQYSEGTLLGNILGYVGPLDEEDYQQLAAQGYLLNDRSGKAGVELSYERVLRGRPGRKVVEIDAVGREIRTLAEDAARPGNSVVLTIDVDLQQKVTEIIQRAMGNGSLNGAAIVMNVHTGEVLALVSLPSYDNNLFSGNVSDEQLQTLLENPGRPLVNHAIAEMYPPGSTFKQVTGVAALQEGVASVATTITSYGSITVKNQYDPSITYVFRDWAALGTLNFYGGVAMSSDVYFYYLAGGYYQDGQEIFRGLDADRLAEYSRAFGIGSPTGIDLPGEAPGLVPDPAWKESTLDEVWVIGDTYNFGIGQGYVATTPLQMLGVTATIANGGDVMVPRVVREVRDPLGNVVVPFQATVSHRLPVDPAHLATFREAMRQAVSWGTAKDAAVRGVAIAGKTGTAEFGEPLPGNKYESHAWFTGFAPAENPEVAVVVFLQKGNGANDAAPVASQILDYYFHRQFLAEGP